MTLIEWKEEFSVGVPGVDLEHRALIELINTLHGMLATGPSNEQVVATLGEIYAQISAHFALEEKFMRETDYEHFASHKDDHEALLDDLRDIMDRVEDDGRYEERRLTMELERWFSEHFRTHDTKLHFHKQA